MKIKVYLTKLELLEVLSSHFNQTVVDVEMTTEPTVAQIVRNAVTALDYKGSQKILAIKALRQVASENRLVEDVLGLGDAKWAIENFDTFIAFVEKNNRLPKDKDGYSYGLK